MKEIEEALSERIESHDSSKEAAIEKLHTFCNSIRKQIDDIEIKITRELEENYTREDDKLQCALSELRTCIPEESKIDFKEITKVIQKAKSRLLVKQTYNFIEKWELEENDISNLCELQVVKETLPEWVYLKVPTNLKVSLEQDLFKLKFDPFTIDGQPVREIESMFTYKALFYKKGAEKGDLYNLERHSEIDVYYTFTPLNFETNTEYVIRVCASYEGKDSDWGEMFIFKSRDFANVCAWKQQYDFDDPSKKYIVDSKNHKIVKYVGDTNCTVTSNTPLPANAVTSWTVKIVNSQLNNGCSIFIGVAPKSVNHNDDGNHRKCGWYYDCYGSTLYSGPPYNCRNIPYGPRKDTGQYVHMGDTIGVTMDTEKGRLSFVVSGINYGVAFPKIPTDEPLFPCVVMGCQNDIVEIIPSEAKENIDEIMPVPENIVAKSDLWNSITLTWDVSPLLIRYNYSNWLYQIEMDDAIQGMLIEKMFTKRRLLPQSTHRFRLRMVKDNTVSRWSEYVVCETAKLPDFAGCVWKESPRRDYSLGRWNPKIVVAGDTNITSWCTVTGTIPLPLSKVTLWSVKVKRFHETPNNDIFVGIAPFDIVLTEERNQMKYGWYLSCYSSKLWAGPPHNSFGNVQYGPVKRDGNYVHKGDTVGVIVDTTKGDLSFVVNGVDYGVAFDGIPLDKPFLPCVLLKDEGDSVELIK